MKYDVIIIGGGLAGFTAALKLTEKGKKCLVISEGLSINRTDRKDYKGSLISGDRVCDFEAEGTRIKSVRTEKLGATILEADSFILATGKFFSRGLCADITGVREPLFGADVDYDADRAAWFDGSFAGHQHFLDFGVKTDTCGRVLIGGLAMDNLYAAGEVLAGLTGAEGNAEDRIRESALKISESIMKQ